MVIDLIIVKEIARLNFDAKFSGKGLLQYMGEL